MKPVRIGFIDERVKKQYISLKESKSEKDLLRFVNRALLELKNNPQCGIRVPDKLILKEYKNMGVTNIWKYNLPDAWRLLYSITGDKIKIVCVILDWMNHKQYERKFKY
jgi:hypothetical protein